MTLCLRHLREHMKNRVKLDPEKMTDNEREFTFFK